ncbi:hypothetical protein GoPhGRU1p85 [Gordonia phage GRU1]|uniref:Uncharacterized protein n=1 Tax=Gordonia phage GRU1 TaxID=1109710 RepID=G8EK44_9CAUD|nr:hypothetical protein GoPhGRU1p85 [Gordonia phage GRU1]AET09926.1 hypothetical protein [Gordonia phage GRU1]
MTDERIIPEEKSRRATTLNLITATLASAAVQSENASRERGWERFAQMVLDNPKLIIFSDNWLTDEEVAAIYAASRDPKLRVDVRPWDADQGLVKTAQDTERLQKWMEAHLPGDQAKRTPSTADSAIMAMDEMFREVAAAKSAKQGIDRLSIWIAHHVPAGEQAWTGNPVDTTIGLLERWKMLDEENRSLSIRVDDAEAQAAAADQQMRAASERLDRLQRWLMLEFGDVLGADEGPVDNAIYIIEELREKYRNADEAKTNADEAKTEISVERNRFREQLEELEKLRSEVRQRAAEAKIPPQSIEDAKREAIRKLADGVPVEEAFGKEKLGRNNRFAGVRSVSTLLGELAGAASMCWENVIAAGEFDSTKAKEIVEEALEQLAEIHSEITAAEDIDDDQVAEAAALYNAIWDPRLWRSRKPKTVGTMLDPINDLTHSAQAFIGGYGTDAGKLFMFTDPQETTNELLRTVADRMGELVSTVKSIAGGSSVTVDTTFDNGPKEPT